MSVVFADSSALLKLYADEHGSDAVRKQERATPFVVSGLARADVPAAFWRKVRMGELDAADARLLTAGFEADWYGAEEDGVRFALMAVSAPLLSDAAHLCEIHDLKASDAVQLASALALGPDEPAGFACFDRRLARAAQAEGLALVGG